MEQKPQFVLSGSLIFRLIFILASGIFIGLGLLGFMSSFWRVLAIVFLAMSIASALSPLVDVLAKRIPRNFAIVLIYVMILLSFAGAVAFIVPSLVVQAQGLIENIPGFFDRVEQWIGQQAWLDSSMLFDVGASQIELIGTSVIGLPVGIISVLVEIVLVIVISMYMLIEAESVRRFGLSLFPIEQRPEVWDVSTEMLNAAGGFVRGVVLNMIIIGTITFIGFSIIGVEFPLVLALISGFFEIIPMVGPLIAAVPAIGVALLQSPTTALITALFLFVVQQFEGNILTS